MNDETPPLSAPEDTMKVVETAVDRLWAVVNELSSIRPVEQECFRVAIFGSARTQPGCRAGRACTSRSGTSR